MSYIVTSELYVLSLANILQWLRLTCLLKINIFISKRNEPLIGDFSSAMMESDPQDPDLDLGGSDIRQMAPELLRYGQDLPRSPKREVWAFGMTIYVSLLLL